MVEDHDISEPFEPICIEDPARQDCSYLSTHWSTDFNTILSLFFKQTYHLFRFLLEKSFILFTTFRRKQRCNLPRKSLINFCHRILFLCDRNILKKTIRHTRRSPSSA